MIYRFGDTELDTTLFELRRRGVPVPVEPQVFDVLTYLLVHRDRVVTKEELLDNVWGDRFVSESALTTRIKTARRAVGDDGQSQQVVRTIHGRGYRFVALVAELDDPEPASPDLPAAPPAASVPTAPTAPRRLSSMPSPRRAKGPSSRRGRCSVAPTRSRPSPPRSKIPAPAAS